MICFLNASFTSVSAELGQAVNPLFIYHKTVDNVKESPTHNEEINYAFFHPIDCFSVSGDKSRTFISADRALMLELCL